MPITVPEPSNYLLFVAHSVALILLLMLYSAGVWSRSFVIPTISSLSTKGLLISTAAMGLITIGVYTRSAFASVAQSEHNIVFDCMIMCLYSIFLGMITREGLEKFSIAISGACSNAWHHLRQHR
jgi:hypothetical protein